MNSTTDITVGRKGQVICRPAEWTDVVIFFFFNYGLHALTVMPAPGATPLITAKLCIYAILAPFAGSLRALLAIHRCTKLEADELAMAHKSGALCMVWRSEDIPGNNLVEVSPRLINIHGQHPVEIPGKWEWVKGVFVHGLYSVQSEQMFWPARVVSFPRRDCGGVEGVRPDPYRIAEVPEDFIVKPLIEPATNDGSATDNHGRREPKLQLSCNYNSIKSLAAILQILYSSFEIYKARGVQLQQFGYAAYSLTVIPYTIMSLINLVASLCEPEYPARFLVHYRGKIDTQAGAIDTNSGHGGAFGAHDSLPTGGGKGDMITRITTNAQETEVLVSGAVGEAFKRTASKQRRAVPEYSTKELWLGTVVFFIGLGSLAAPYIIIKLLTNFHSGQSTRSQRVWIMLWLVLGQYIAPTFYIYLLSPRLMRNPGGDKTVNEFEESRILMGIGLLIITAVTAIGGFVVIAKMIRYSDVCKTI